MKKNKIIYSLGIHRDGGLVVLKTLLNKRDYFFYLDNRLNPSYYSHLKKENYIVQKNKFYNLFINSLNFLRLKENSKIIFLSSSLPLFKLKCFVVSLYQNSNIFYDKNNMKIINWVLSLDFIRFLFFIIFRENVDQWVVFSNYSKVQLSKKIRTFSISKITIISFIVKKLIYNNSKKKIYDFIYPANLMPHKNHNNLFKAFIILSKKGIRPSLALTLNRDELKSIKYNLLKNKINLNNLYSANRKIFLKNFSKCKYLIYPSLNENIGLPLVEAHYLGLEIIASKLDFAKQYDFIDYFFNPLSPKDIASSVVRILNKKKIKKNMSYYNYNNDSIPFTEYF
jgi:glycosyltransferase involved in cell wall biosynthesis